MSENLKGRILFYPGGYTFFEILSVFPLEPEFGELRRIKVIDLSNGEESVSQFLQSIGEEFILVDPSYPKEKIEVYLSAVKQEAQAHETMLNVTHEVLLGSESKIETCLGCGGAGKYGMAGQIIKCGNCEGTGHDPEGPFEVWQMACETVQKSKTELS